jgi:serine/threonine protein kinase
MQTVRGTELYMSPILYKALKTEPSKGVNHNVFKSDVFSLGMCFLLASCLDYKCLYDMRKVKNMIDVKNLVKKYVDNKYSYNFVDILTRMLNLYEKDRPDFIELSSMV